MLWIRQRKLFKKWKLTEKSWFFWYAIIEYDLPWIIYVKRTVNSKKQLWDFLFDLYWCYEYEWKEMSARAIADLLCVDKSVVDKILARARRRIKEWLSEWIRNGYKKTTILENLDILI